MTFVINNLLIFTNQNFVVLMENWFIDFFTLNIPAGKIIL